MKGVLVSLAGGAVLAQLLSLQNQQEFERSNEEARDTSRPGFKSYGLNFGFRTDSTVRLTDRGTR